MRFGGRLCANCFKIVESLNRTADRHGGSVAVTVRGRGHVSAVLTCEAGHSWAVGMHSRRAKAWCR